MPCNDVMKRVLIISPHFPPVNAPDMQRVRLSLPYFVEAGWDVTVLTVDDPTPTAPLEPELMATLPAAVRIERTFCCSRRWTAFFGINNVALRALPFLFFRGCSLLLSRRYDAVYFSTTMFIVLPFGRLWKNLFNVPYVIDLQDPWVTDYYDRPGAPRPPGGWKYQIAHGMGRILEGWTTRGAAHLLTVSASYVDALRERHPALAATAFTELPFGAADLDLQHAAQKRGNSGPLLPAGGCRLVFAGAIGPGMLPAIETLFAALTKWRRSGPPVSVHFFGTSYSPGARAKPVTLELAVRHGLQDCVFERPDRLRYFDALQVTVEADINLLFGSSDLGFTPSKMMTTLAAGRPVLALVPAGSAMAQRLTTLNLPFITIPADGRDHDCVRRIVDRLQLLSSPTADFPDPSALTRYSARAMAGQQLSILQQIADQS